MNKELEFLQNLFGSGNQSISFLVFFIQILVTTILSLLISYIYIRFGNALSNRKALAKTFVLIGLTTMIIITIVKSSLALSLGLVGALSIVRFRTAIKEPEELAYFFIVIAIGLGVGAEQILITITGTICLSILIIFINRQKTEDIIQNLIIKFNTEKDNDIEKIILTLEKYCSQLELRRLDEDQQMAEVSFSVSFDNYKKLLTAKKELQYLYPTITFSFLELL